MRRAVSAVGSVVLLLSFAGAVGAAAPVHSYAISACYDATTYGDPSVVMTQSWAGFNADSFSDGFTFFGEQFSFPRAKQGTESGGAFNVANLATEPTWSAALLFHGRTVASGQLTQPAGGWATLAPC
jgi:hypothetical protein